MGKMVGDALWAYTKVRRICPDAAQREAPPPSHDSRSRPKQARLSQCACILPDVTRRGMDPWLRKVFENKHTR